MAGQVFAIASGKGGVGKTTTVVNLGVVLRRAEHSVALVDADLGMANLASMLGVSGERTLHDVLAGEAGLEEALVEEAPGFAVLAGSEALLAYADADPAGLGEVVEELAAAYDFVLVDTGAGMSHEDVLPLGLADGVLLVASPDPAAVGDTRKTADLAGLADGDIAGLVVTKAAPDTDASRVAAEVGADLLGVIPFDPTVRESTTAGRPLEAVDPETPAATAYRDLANALAAGAPDPLQPDPAAEETATDAPEASGPEVDAAAVEPTTDDSGSDEVEPETSAAPDPAEEPDASEPAVEPPAADEAAGDGATAGSGDEPAADLADSSREEAEEAPAPDEAAGTVAEEADAQDEAEEAGAPETAAAEAPEAVADESGDDDAEEDAEDEEPEDYLAEFEDDEPERKRGLFSRLTRLFR